MGNAATELFLEAVLASMNVIRRYQLGSVVMTNLPELKANGTIKTIIDTESGEAGLKILNRLPSDYRIVIEDVKTAAKAGATKKVLNDSLDGTTAITIGLPTSAVILADYNIATKHVTECHIGCPALECVWSASGGKQTVIRRINPETQKLGDAETVKVWKGDLNKKASVFLDVSHGFTRKGRQILTDKQVGRLFCGLASQSKVQIPGSNGLMHALMANGGFGLAGSITTAMDEKGGYDAAGGFLVEGAKGFLKAFRMEDGYPFQKDPLDVESFDILITGNTRTTIQMLTKQLFDACDTTKS